MFVCFGGVSECAQPRRAGSELDGDRRFGRDVCACVYIQLIPRVNMLSYDSGRRHALHSRILNCTDDGRKTFNNI